MFLVLLSVVTIAFFLHNSPQIKGAEIIENRNISCASVIKDDYIGFDVSGWLSTKFNEGWVEASKMIPKDPTYIMPVVMNVENNCNKDLQFTYCPIGAVKEFNMVDDDGNVIGKERVWVKLKIKSDRIETVSLDNQQDKLHATRTKYYIESCTVEDAHSEKS